MSLAKEELSSTSLDAALACKPALLIMVVVAVSMNSLLIEFPVSHLYVAALSGEYFSEFFTHVDRTMLPSGAAQSHGNIAPIVTLEARYPFLQEVFYVTAHLLHFLLGIKKANDCVIQTGERA